MASSSSTTPSLSSTRRSMSQTRLFGPASSMLGTVRWSSQSLTASAVDSASASATNSSSILQLSSASAAPSRIFVARRSSTISTRATSSSIGNYRMASSSSTISAGTSLPDSLSRASTSSPILSSSKLTLTSASTIASASTASLFISVTSTTSFSSSIASSTSSTISTDPVSQLSSTQTTVIASVAGSLGSVLIIAIIFVFFVRQRRRRHFDSHSIFTRSQPQYAPAAGQGTSTPRSQMTQNYAQTQAQTPLPTSSTQRSYPPSSSTSDLSHARFLGSLFTRSRRDTGVSHLSNSTQGMSSHSAVEQSGFMKISGRKLERWQDPELASIHSISGRIYDPDGREIVRPVAGPSTHEDLRHDEAEDDQSEGRRSSCESLGPDDGQFQCHVGTPTIPAASSIRPP
ncbi:uncharacterized protein V1513DRAFT_85199 [Lipomyces chichibuensis]|uniref:uncharacterized protein n=1 Tax=Lipomyces chichibuensis TaxID=1546026 RepID=UPI0033430C6B